MKISTEEFLLNTVSIGFIFTSTFVLLPLRQGIDSRFTIGLVFLFVGVLFIVRSKGINLGPLDSFLARMRKSMTLSFFVRWRRVTMTILIYIFAFLLLVFRISRMGASATFDEPTHLAMTRSLAPFSLESWIETMKTPSYMQELSRNPPLPYFLMAILLRPFDFSLLAGRVISSLLAALIPVVLFYMLCELLGDSTMAISISAAYVMSIPFQGAMFIFDFDALSTLLFTLCVCSFIMALKSRNRSYFAYSMIAGILLTLTKYPPAGWLLLGSIITVFFHREVRSGLSVILVTTLMGLLIVSIASPVHLSLAAQYFASRALKGEYAIELLRDLTVIIGWSPYLAFAFKFAETWKAKDPISTFSVVLIILAFVTPIFDPVTRRLIQVIPLFAVTLLYFSTRRWSRTTSLLILMNFCWWGVIKLPYV